jgi:hypothetical protein
MCHHRFASGIKNNPKDHNRIIRNVQELQKSA